jgi:hypothetical protein
MSNNTRESTVTPFGCSLVGRQVQISRLYTILRSNGAELARAPIRTSCSDQERCPIATHKGNSTSYDWSKCVFSNAQK